MSNGYKKIAENKICYRSCIMKEEQPYMERFETLGISKVFTNKDGVLIIDIPSENIQEFVNLYLELMKPGRWNEYVGPTTGFYFKLPSGEAKHIPLTDSSESGIKDTLKVFVPNWDEDKSLWDWLASIDIYEDWLHVQ